jgi:cell division septal protein FtsQ
MPGPERGARRAAPAAVGRTRKPAERAGRTTSRGAVAPGTPSRRGPRLGDRLHAVWATGQLAAFLLALICGVAIAIFLGSDLLTVRRFDVTGATLTTPQQLADAGAVQGHNIFTVDTQEVAERLIALPTVREAQVQGALPDRLVVRLVERQPAAVWRVGDARFLVDQGGFVMVVNPADEAIRGLPQVVVRDGSAPVIGAQLAPELVAATVTIARDASTYGVTVAEIDYSPASGLTILTPSSAQATAARQIRIGQPTRLPEKLAASGEVIRTEQRWTILDVTDPERPFFPAP